MKIRLLSLAVAFILVAQTTVVFAQGANPLAPESNKSVIYTGPVFGYNSVSHTAQKLATFSGDSYCPFFNGGTGQGFYFGWSYEQHLGKKIEESTSSIIARVIYSMYPGSMTVAGDDYPSLVPSDQNPSEYRIVRSKTKHDVDISYSVIAAEVMYKQNISTSIPLGITAGPTFEFPISKKVTQKYKLLTDGVEFADDPNFTYEDNHKTVVVKDGDINNGSGFRFGIKVGIQYEIIVGQGWYLVPAAYYNYSITKVKTDEDWRINAFQVGMDIRFAF